MRSFDGAWHYRGPGKPKETNTWTLIARVVIKPYKYSSISLHTARAMAEVQINRDVIGERIRAKGLTLPKNYLSSLAPGTGAAPQ
jgi:hypothetical protein